MTKITTLAQLVVKANAPKANAPKPEITVEAGPRTAPSRPRPAAPKPATARPVPPKPDPVRPFQGRQDPAPGPTLLQPAPKPGRGPGPTPGPNSDRSTKPMGFNRRVLDVHPTPELPPRGRVPGPDANPGTEPRPGSSRRPYDRPEQDGARITPIVRPMPAPVSPDSPLARLDDLLDALRRNEDHYDDEEVGYTRRP